MSGSKSNTKRSKFVPTSGSRLGVRHKDKKQRITEVLGDLQLAMAGIAMRGEGLRSLHELVELVQSLARVGSVFLRKLVLDRDNRLLDDEVLRSLKMRLQPLIRIPRSKRRVIEAALHVDQVAVQITRIADGDGNPIMSPEPVVITGGSQGYSMLVEWPLLGVVNWTATGDGITWDLSADQLFDIGSKHAMSCDEWLGQQVVLFDQRGITLEKILRTVANQQGAHSVNVGRLTVKEAHVHIVNNIALFGLGYMDLIVVEVAIYLYSLLIDEPSIECPVGEIYVAMPAFECPPAEDARSKQPSWLRYLGNTMLVFNINPGIESHRVRAPASC